MAQKLIIKWKDLPGMLPPMRESFLCKSEDAAHEILDKRNKENIEEAVLFHDDEIINLKSYLT